MDVSHHADDFPGLRIAAAVVIGPRTRKREGRLGEALSDRGLAAEGLARERFADDRDARSAGCVAIGEEAAGQQPEPNDIGVVGTDGADSGQQLFPRVVRRGPAGHGDRSRFDYAAEGHH